MAALITSVMGNTDKVVEYIRECGILGIDVLKPDINRSYSKFSVEDKSIRFGLAAVKNVGVNIIENIVKEREISGQFKNITDLVKRLDSKDTNKRVMESLIKCGAFDEISENRASLMASYEGLLDSVSQDRKKNIQGQISLFDSLSEESNQSQIQDINQIISIKEFEERERLSLEKEVLGLYVSGHPLSEFEEDLIKNTSIDNGKLNNLKEDEQTYLSLDEKEVIIGGMIVNKNIKTTKRNDIMAFLELEDLYGTIEIVVFPQILKKYNHMINEDSIVLIKGRLNIKEDEDPKLIANEIIDIQDIKNQKKVNNNSKEGLYLKIDSFKNTKLIENIYAITSRYLGNENIFLYGEEDKKMYKWSAVNITISQQLINELKDIIPEENIKIK